MNPAMAATGMLPRCPTKFMLPHRSRVPRLKKSRNGISISKRALSEPVLRIVRILALSKLLVRGRWFCQEGIKAAGD
jgi:hypothetical protein